MPGEKILVVEDDPSILVGVRDTLESEGFAVVTARDGEAAIKAALAEDPDVVVLDVMLPRLSGIDVCRRLHEERIRGAILMLTAKAAEADKVRGFQAGADDYLTKPFSVVELLLRVRALLRRTRKREDQIASYAFGTIALDFAKFEATRAGKPLELTPREFKILRLFCENAGKVVTRNELLDKVWGYDIFPTTRTVDNHIVKLRKAIEDDPGTPRFILSVRGVGYKFDPTGASPEPAELLPEGDTAGAGPE
ncbi:MAG TPA: response regulator transcription factor [Planctomycetota bacterium]|nr:response regulator transcription factor [Planctomycetota bacterium]